MHGVFQLVELSWGDGFEMADYSVVTLEKRIEVSWYTGIIELGDGLEMADHPVMQLGQM